MMNPFDVIEDFITNPRYSAAPSLNMADLLNFEPIVLPQIC